MKINIGTTKGNIVGYEINKKFNEIKMADIKAIVEEKFPNGAIIIGWAKSHPYTRLNVFTNKTNSNEKEA